MNQLTILTPKNSEDPLLGAFQNIGRLVASFITLTKDVSTDFCQSALNPLVANDLGIVFNVCGMRNRFKNLE